MAFSSSKLKNQVAQSKHSTADIIKIENILRAKRVMGPKLDDNEVLFGRCGYSSPRKSFVCSVEMTNEKHRITYVLCFVLPCELLGTAFLLLSSITVGLEYRNSLEGT